MDLDCDIKQLQVAAVQFLVQFQHGGDVSGHVSAVHFVVLGVVATVVGDDCVHFGLGESELHVGVHHGVVVDDFVLPQGCVLGIVDGDGHEFGSVVFVLEQRQSVIQSAFTN